MTVAWVIGSRGMLGSAIVRGIARRPGWRVLDADPLPWTGSAGEVAEAAIAASTHLFDTAEADGDRWAIVWAAGAGVTSSSESTFDEEFDRLAAILTAIGPHAANAATGGSIFYASSAGGVYAGGTRPPFTELSEPAPIAPYGRFKMRAEALVREVAAEAGIASLIGRIANLYGPGQRLDKLQGLISHIALARLTSRPASIYVPLDTLRDYILVDDCAELVLDALERLETEGGHVTKILASGQPASIATLLGHFRTITGGRPRVVLGSSAAGALQAHDLRLRSVVWPDLDLRRGTGLPAGINATMMDILARIQSGAA